MRGIGHKPLPERVDNQVHDLQNDHTHQRRDIVVHLVHVDGGRPILDDDAGALVDSPSDRPLDVLTASSLPNGSAGCSI
jgi:hypothetical protein